MNKVELFEVNYQNICKINAYLCMHALYSMTTCFTKKIKAISVEDFRSIYVALKVILNSFKVICNL